MINNVYYKKSRNQKTGFFSLIARLNNAKPGAGDIVNGAYFANGTVGRNGA
jgi:hypothetical protein